ncbi:17354_t:CDS:2 [Entrophospora sp. SA101]|nr:17354_t:CDS:2 [Entrophospora sp. SA101]
MKLGSRVDSIIITFYGKSSIALEYGGSEVAKNYEGKKSTKWLFEADLKLPKVLKDMLLLLNSHISDMKERRKLITVGYIHGGLQLMFMTLDNPAGYVFCLVKSSLYSIPVSFQNFTEALELIASVWTMKQKPVKFGGPMIKGADQENQNTNISKKRSISKNDTPISNKRININD